VSDARAHGRREQLSEPARIENTTRGGSAQGGEKQRGICNNITEEEIH